MRPQSRGRIRLTGSNVHDRIQIEANTLSHPDDMRAAIAASTYHHQTCTAKMGRDAASVVDAQLRVYGIQNLRIADGSIMPRVTTGNTMAPCIVIGERAGEMLRDSHKI